MCVIEADTAKVARTEHTMEDGSTYYAIHYDVVLQFGLTELQAQIAYMEDVSFPFGLEVFDTPTDPYVFHSAPIRESKNGVFTH